MFTQLKNLFLDLLFPVRCVGCKRDGVWFCTECGEKVKLKTSQYCPSCWCNTTGGHNCENCDTSSLLTGLRVAASYEANPELARAVKQLKYRFSEPLADALGEILARSVRQTNYTGERIITFVPLHLKRQRWRGFNQAELLARAVGHKLKLPVEDLLTRVRNTPPQAKLDRTTRLTNLKDAFAVQSNLKLQGKTILLVDDVASTGASLAECARVLRAAGAKSVWGLVLARG